MTTLCKSYPRTTAALLLAGLAIVSALPAGAQMKPSASAIQPNPMNLKSTNMVTMIVANVDKETEWYVNVLGFREIPEPGAGTPNPNAPFKVRKVELNGFFLHLVQIKGSRRAPVKAAYSNELEGYNHISFQTQFVDESYKWLTAHGVTGIEVDRDKKTDKPQTLKLLDPEGNEIHIEHPN